jgi:hypothetical protein
MVSDITQSLYFINISRNIILFPGCISGNLYLMSLMFQTSAFDQNAGIVIRSHFERFDNNCFTVSIQLTKLRSVHTVKKIKV